jgi:hypothetical protein
MEVLGVMRWMGRWRRSGGVGSVEERCGERRRACGGMAAAAAQQVQRGLSSHARRLPLPAARRDGTATASRARLPARRNRRGARRPAPASDSSSRLELQQPGRPSRSPSCSKPQHPRDDGAASIASCCPPALLRRLLPRRAGLAIRLRRALSQPDLPCSRGSTQCGPLLISWALLRDDCSLRKKQSPSLQAQPLLPVGARSRGENELNAIRTAAQQQRKQHSDFASSAGGALGGG